MLGQLLVVIVGQDGELGTSLGHVVADNAVLFTDGLHLADDLLNLLRVVAL